MSSSWKTTSTSLIASPLPPPEFSGLGGSGSTTWVNGNPASTVEAGGSSVIDPPDTVTSGRSTPSATMAMVLPFRWSRPDQTATGVSLSP